MRLQDYLRRLADSDLLRTPALVGLVVVAAILAWPFVGIDIAPTYSEHEVGTLPVPFFKHSLSLRVIFESPTDPGDIMRGHVPSQQKDALAKFCAIRYGAVTVDDCLPVIRADRESSGFYLPD